MPGHSGCPGAAASLGASLSSDPPPVGSQPSRASARGVGQLALPPECGFATLAFAPRLQAGRTSAKQCGLHWLDGGRICFDCSSKLPEEVFGFCSPVWHTRSAARLRPNNFEYGCFFQRHSRSFTSIERLRSQPRDEASENGNTARAILRGSGPNPWRLLIPSSRSFPQT